LALFGLLVLVPTDTDEHPPGRAHRTVDGRWVASTGEQRIANWLAEHGIDYAYEPEIAGGLTPDFKIEGTDVVIEYWGMAGHEDYEQRLAEKLEIYEEHGIDVVSLFPMHVGEVDDVLERELSRRGIDARTPEP
jgi:hypothetical protein